MTTLDAKIPSEWLRQDRRALALAIEQPLSCGKTFGRTKESSRDSYGHKGAYVRSPRQQKLELPPSYWHPRATCSGSTTKTELIARRLHNKHLECLKFEPSEIERLRDIPKANQLENWWKCPVSGSSEDPSNAVFFRESLRLRLAHRSNELGPVDPAKCRSVSSVGERQLLRRKRGDLTDKVTHIRPDSYIRTDGGTTATGTSDQYPNERRAASASTPKLVWSLPASLIDPPAKISNSQHKVVENIVLDCTSQRAVLDQFKSCLLSSSRPLSTSSAEDNGVSLSPNMPSFKSIQGRGAFKNSIRCGGFS